LRGQDTLKIWISIWEKYASYILTFIIAIFGKRSQKPTILYETVVLK